MDAAVPQEEKTVWSADESKRNYGAFGINYSGCHAYLS